MSVAPVATGGHAEVCCPGCHLGPGWCHAAVGAISIGETGEIRIFDMKSVKNQKKLKVNLINELNFLYIGT